MGGSSKKVIVGYKYFLGVHMGLCHGPVDRLIRVRVDGRDAWVGDNTGGPQQISAEGLFGGEKREGGVAGQLDFEQGLPDQTANTYLVNNLPGGLVPAFRGICAVVLRRMYIGLNPYLKSWDFRVMRVHVRQNGLDQWYDEKAEITRRIEAFIAIEVDSCNSLDGWTLDAGGIADRILSDGSVIYNNGLEANNSTIYRKTLAAELLVTEISFDVSLTAIANGDALRLALRDSNGNQWFQFFPVIEAGHDALRRPSFRDQSTPIGTGPLDVGDWYTFVGTYDYDAQTITQVIKERDTGVVIATRVDAIPNVGFAKTLMFVRDGDSCSVTNCPSTSAYDNISIAGYVAAGDMNPAHIIRECLTDPDWGMGYQEADIDEDSFAYAADVLFAEGLGISVLWDKQDTIEDFISDILKHINAQTYVDQATGKFVLKLIRDDYDEPSLLVLDPSNVEAVEGFSLPSPDELVNAVTVQYWDAANSQDGSVTVQDTAAVQMLGVVIAQTFEYRGFTNRSVATKVAQRDLKALSTPLASCTLYANRQAASLNIGSAFKFTWPDYGVNEMVMRVTGIAFGDGLKNVIRIQATQDAFAQPEVELISTPPTEWVNPSGDAEPATVRIVQEAPYFEVVRDQGQDATDALLDIRPEAGFLMASAVRPTSSSVNATLDVDSGAGYVESTTLDFPPYAVLSEDMPQADTSTVSLSEVGDIDSIEVGAFGQVDDEIVKVLAISESSMTVSRGCLDTVPTAHMAGSYILFWDGFGASDNTEYADGESLDVKILTNTGSDTLDEDDAPVDTATMDQRAFRPYPPGNLQFNGYYYPASISPSINLTISWSHRDRLQQTGSDLVEFTEGNIGPEAGVTYNLRIYDQNDVLVTNEIGLSGTSYEWADETGGYDPALYHAAVLASSPYLYYKMEEGAGTTATDASGNGRHGTYASVGITYGGVSGPLFDPTGDVDSQLNSGIATNFTTFSLEFMFKPQEPQVDPSRFLVSKSSYFATATTDFPVAIAWSGADRVVVNLSMGDDFSADATLLSAVLDDTQEHHVVYVHRNSGLCELYVDGDLVDSETIAFSISTNARNWMLAAASFEASGGVDTSRYKGFMRRFAIYNAALTSTDVSDHYNALGIAGARNNTVRVELESQRLLAGSPTTQLVSFQKHDVTLYRYGYGYNYGKFYGGPS